MYVGRWMGDFGNATNNREFGTHCLTGFFVAKIETIRGNK